MDTGLPANIGAAIHVIADPAGQPERHRLGGLPQARPVRGGDLQHDLRHPVARILRLRQG